MKLTYYGHSCFSIQIENEILLFDPFVTLNELAKHIDIMTIKANYILVSHGHGDHVADCITLAKATGAKVICSWEIHEWLNKKGITDTHPMNIGGKWNFGVFTIKCTVAQHSSGLPDGNYAGNPMGFIVTSSKGNFYYSGDTGLTLDMQLIPRWANLDFAILPIGDNFTMDATDAVACAEMIQCQKIIGVHYDTFGLIKIDHKEAIKVFQEAGLKLVLAGIGETIEI